jgi:hypothetical protein
MCCNKDRNRHNPQRYAAVESLYRTVFDISAYRDTFVEILKILKASAKNLPHT